MISGIALLLFGLAVGGCLYAAGRYSIKMQRAQREAKRKDRDAG